ncbi:hypothetical protein [Comamonas thiooxydans]|uniref:hypothetical protein n=1 Tax=Comamonas thiooxydans TaxID=363952 RepID=UPI000B41A8D5|nr:hypothetical protein [Comamonas thiooxydans]
MQITNMSLSIQGEQQVPLAGVVEALAKFGVTVIHQVAIVNVRAVPANGQEIWLQVTSDEQEPYYVVQGAYEQGDSPIGPELLETLQREGVCTEVAIQYPRTDRYGIPDAANNAEAAKALATDHLFAVADVGFDTTGVCTEDDTAETVWLRLVYPAKAN